MKFYYNNELVRTSKNHHYTHAVIDVSGKWTGKAACVGCRTNEVAAAEIKLAEIRAYENGIECDDTAIRALEKRQAGYMVKDGRRKFFHRFSETDTIEKYENHKKRNFERIDYVRRNWEVVELEER